jgi:hypothetical protein
MHDDSVESWHCSPGTAIIGCIECASRKGLTIGF